MATVGSTIVGSGLIARAFAAHEDALGDTCVYAAGVSNSSCTDPREFERERQRLLAAMGALSAETLFLYFSTCSVDDPAAQGGAYALHKLAMERLVAQRNRYLIFRLPQLAGATPNPHTLLNYLYARIVRSERFAIWSGASRNIIDVDDVARIATDLMATELACGEIINIANSHNSSIVDIVKAMEAVLGHPAIFDIIERGAGYAIATDRIQQSLHRCRISFSGDYLYRTIRKYYAHNDAIAT
jgi:nucleoside-diphosphate-sugar epimerase